MSSNGKPKKTGKQRKAKRRARRQEHGTYELEKSGVDPAEAKVIAALQRLSEDDKENTQLVRQSLRWNEDKAVQLSDVSRTELRRLASKGLLSGKDIAMLVTRRHMLSDDPSISINGVRNQLSMEMMNQRDDLADKRQTTFNQQINISGTSSLPYDVEQQVLDMDNTIPEEDVA